jgi:uncharacterized protein YjbI with pentapeptide repeats
VRDEVIVVGAIRRAVAVASAVAFVGTTLAGCGGNGGKAATASCGERLAAAVKQAGIGFVDLSGCDLSGRKLADLNMYHWDLSRARFVGADLTYAHLDSADFSGADLSGADLTGATLVLTKVRGATFDRAVLDDAKLSRVDLAGATLTGVSLKTAQLSQVSIAGGSLQDVDLAGASLTGVDLTEAQLRDADLTRARTEDVDLTGATLERVTLKWTDLTGASGLSDRALASAFQVAPARLAQALAVNGTGLEKDEDIAVAVQGVCRGTSIPGVARGVSTPPRIARAVGKAEWTSVGERHVAAARFVDVVVCVGPIASRKVGRCGPYTGHQPYFATYAESATVRLVDPRSLASTSVTITSSPPEHCPTYLGDPDELGRLDLSLSEHEWLSTADRFARQHQG